VAARPGLQLALGLLKKGYEIRVVQNRTAEEIEKGRVLSSQCMFGDSIQAERDLGIDFWTEYCPPVEGISFTVPHPEKAGEKVIDWVGPSGSQCIFRRPARQDPGLDGRIRAARRQARAQGRGHLGYGDSMLARTIW
jgi:hypothetical protein